MYRTIEKYIDKMLCSPVDAPIWNVEVLIEKKKPHWNYIDGCLMTSLMNLYLLTKQPKYYEFVKKFIDFYINDKGEMLGYDRSKYNLDDINEGRVLFDLYEISGEEKYKKAIDFLYDTLTVQPRTIEGSFWHKLIYPNQVWLDGLYMAQVFNAKYRLLYAKADFRDISRQFGTVRKRMYDSKAKLFYHGYDASKKAFWCNENGLSKSFWLRSMGWFAVALVDVIDVMPPCQEREELTDIFILAVSGLLDYQDKDSKMFYQVIDKGARSGNYLESSGSAMISYALLKGSRLGIIDASFRTKGEEIFKGICDKYLTEVDGELNLGGICLMAGLGPENNRRRDGSYEYYVSEPIVKNDAKGIAPLIMAYVELITK